MARAAEAGYGMSSPATATLAQQAGVSEATVRRAEATPAVPTTSAANLFRIQRALEQAGVIFIDANDVAGAGVRFRQPTP